MENKQNIIDEDVQARLDLLDTIIDSKCEYEGAENVAKWLQSEFGITSEQLKKWGFDVPAEIA